MADDHLTATTLRQRDLILDAAASHMAHEARAGSNAAIERAVADIIGASEFLVHLLGRDRARAVLGAVLESL